MKEMQSYLKYLTIVIFVGFCLATELVAQVPAPKELSLQEALEKAMAGNSQIKVANYDVETTQTEVKGINSFYLPQIEAAVSGSITNLPLNVFGSRLQQGAVEQSDFLPSSLNDPDPLTNLQTQISIKQPLLNLDARPMKNAMRARSMASERQVVNTRKQLRFQVVQAYLQLQLLYEVKEVFLKAQKTTEANLKVTQDRLNEGYLQKVDLLSVEIRLKEIENQLFETTNNIQNMSDRLSFLMGIEIGTQFIPTDQLTDFQEIMLPADSLPNNWSESKAIAYQVDAQRLMLKSAQRTYIPRINVFGAYEVNNSLDFEDYQHGYLFMVQASWKIFNGNKSRTAVQKARINLDKYETNLDQSIAQNQLQYKMAKRQLLDARNKITLAEKTVEHAKEILKIKMDRYEEGLEETADILLAETEVARKEVDYFKAIYQQQLASEQIKLLVEE